MKMLNDSFAEFTADLNLTMQEILKSHISDVAMKIIKELDKDGSEVLEWGEFKEYMHVFTKEKTEIMQIIKKAQTASKY